jgi:hypothetical protein
MVFNVQTDELYRSFLDLKVTTTYSEFKHELLICFWLSVELGTRKENASIEVPLALSKVDPLISQIIFNLRKNGKELIEKKERLAALNAKKNSFFGQ